jgi:hypothetical protein
MIIPEVTKLHITPQRAEGWTLIKKVFLFNLNFSVFVRQSIRIRKERGLSDLLDIQNC